MQVLHPLRHWRSLTLSKSLVEDTLQAQHQLLLLLVDLRIDLEQAITLSHIPLAWRVSAADGDGFWSVIHNLEVVGDDGANWEWGLLGFLLLPKLVSRLLVEVFSPHDEALDGICCLRVSQTSFLLERIYPTCAAKDTSGEPLNDGIFILQELRLQCLERDALYYFILGCKILVWVELDVCRGLEDGIRGSDVKPK